MRFESLLTDRLRVRRLESGDAEALSRYRSHPLVSRFQTAYDLDRARRLIEEMSDSDPSLAGRWFQFGIELRSGGQLIGDVGFLNTDGNGRSWLGFTLDPRYRAHGYATESVRAVLSHYRGAGITEVWASTDPENESSQRLLKRMGFALTEEKPDDRLFTLRLAPTEPALLG